MGRFANAFGPHAPDARYTDHTYEERLFDTGEVQLNHVIAGDAAKPALLGAASDLQVARADALVTGAGNAFELVSLPTMGHSMHGQDPQQFTDILTTWVTSQLR
jgi:pimeloyl-ACP methyl ester carboxylesterase